MGDDAALNRREFIERTAAAAGLATLSTALPVDVLVSEAAAAQARRNRLPSPRNIEIDHFVILMMENRSFDHYLGWVPGADGVQAQKFRNEQGVEVPTRPASTLGGDMWQGCGHPDPGHGWRSGRAQLRGGFLAKGSGNDEFALTYYNRGELGFIHKAAERYTTYDRYFCSLLTSTWPNRYYKWSAQSAGKTGNIDQVDFAQGGNQWETIFDRALKRGVSARYYASDLPFSVVWGARALAWTNPVARFHLDCATGTLPNISIIDPPFRDGGGGDGISADEHPLGDVRLGQAFMSDVVNAFVQSPNYRRGALFIVYDEWGGFFDHVRPPRVPDSRSTRNLDTDFGQLGFRTPAVAISPYARRRGKDFRVDHGTYAHESILKLIAYRFGLGNLTKRMRYTRNIGRSFDWENPDFDRPDLPNAPDVASAPCVLGGAGIFDAAEAHAGDLAGLEALAHRFGFPVWEGKTHELFNLPDSLRRALAIDAP